MYSRRIALCGVLFLAPMVLCITGASQTPDEDEPEVKARVARVTFVSGDVQIKRAGETDWEVVKQDLPVVEGDEITTDANARVEIQLSRVGHLRLDQNSYLRVATFRDEGIALSVPRGTLSVRLLDLDKDKSYVEIDAPKTTVALQKAGIYRIDAGTEDSKQIRISVTGSGEARVYSDNSGFTLKNGRTSTINIEGDREGEWETTDAAQFADDFDSWALDRDVAIEKKLGDAYYDKYYDADIYGAEDLNDNGEWIHTNKYGYVWRPYTIVTSRYADWSPYRYGEWRWIPPFGWTWVNDEPWGWATYHHGRWFFDGGYWYWSPYGSDHNHRSWWSPALVFITILSDDICWYPLPFGYGYFDFNSYYYGGGRRHGRHDERQPNPRPSPAPQLGGVIGPGRIGSMPYYQVPVGGVVKMPASSFGTGKGGIQKAPPEIAKGVLAKNPTDANTIPRLPKFDDIKGKVSGSVRVEKPIQARVETKTSTGATERKANKPLDDELRTTRVMGKRPPIVEPVVKEPPRVDQGGNKLPDTGAVGRPVKLPAPVVSPVKTVPRSDQTSKPDVPKIELPKNNPPRRSVEPRIDQPKREEPKYTPPPKPSPPIRPEPPTKAEPPKPSPPIKPDPPTKAEPPRPSPPTKPEPPKGESKPDTGRKKDGSR